MTIRTLGLCVSYNGVCLQDCELLQWDHRIEYDEGHNQKWDVIQLTVASMVVSNANTVNAVAVPNDNDAKEPNRRHASQALETIDSNKVWPQKRGFLAVDNLVAVMQLLKRPKCDFVMWLNDAATATQSAVPPEQTAERTQNRRILLAACGWASAEDFKTPATTEGEFVNVMDPQLDSEKFSKTKIKRRDVLDCCNGPRPISVQPQSLAGGKVVRLHFTIEIVRTIPSGKIVDTLSNQQGDNEERRKAISDNRKESPIIYNRWSVSDSEDDSGRVTHTISGKLIVSDKRYKPNAMRLMAFPLAFPFARLASRRYTVSEDGKTLAYEFNMTHAGMAPPPGVRDYTASYSEKFSPYVPGHLHGEMSIQVKGWYHRTTDDPTIMVTEQTQKTVLLRQAHTILWARIRGLAPKLQPLPGQDANLIKLLGMQVIETVGKPELELRAEVQYQPEPNDIYLRLQNLGKPFFDGLQAISQWDPMWWPIDNEWGRLTRFDDAHPDYEYLPLGNTTGWKPYDDYMNQPAPESLSSNHIAQKLSPITQAPKDYKVDLAGDGLTLNPQGDYTGSTNGGEPSERAIPKTTNPINQKPFLAQISQALNGLAIPAATPPVVSYNTGIYDAGQIYSGFAYVSYEAETMSDAQTGKIAMPLSKSRDFNGGNLAFQNGGGGSGGVKPKETVATIRLFAGSGRRVVNVKAERIDDWPEMPVPAEQIARYDLTASDSEQGSQVVAYDRLIEKKIIHDAPRPFQSGQGVVFTTNMQLVYSCSRPWAPTESQAGYSSQDLFPIAINKMLKHDGFTQAQTKQRASLSFNPNGYT